MVHVFSGYVGVQPKFVDQVKENHSEYCSRHGYEYVFFDDWPSGQRPTESTDFFTAATWLKPAILNWAIKSGISEIMWMDTDSVFNDQSMSLDDLLPPSGKSLTITGDASDVCNAGHIIARNSPTTQALFDLWMSLGKHRFPKLNTSHQDLDGYLVDQAALNIILGGGRNSVLYFLSKAETIFNSINGYVGNADRQHRLFQYTHAPTRVRNLRRALSLIHHDWRPHINLVPQFRLNSYVFPTPGAPKPDQADPILHFVGESKEQLKVWLSDRGY